MIRPLTTLAALPAIALLSAPLFAAEVQISATGPVVELTISEQVKAAPDIANVSAGVTTQAATAVEAMRMNAREMSAVIARIKSLGIDEDDIQTTGINLSAQYDYDGPNQRQVFRGYQVSNRVSIVVRDVEAIGPILDALVAAGTTDLGGPSFSIDDDSEAKALARKMAMATALTRANEYAVWAGYSKVRLLQVSENIASGRPVEMGRTRAMAMDASAANTPVQPGMVGTSVTVSVTYEMFD